jgi:hypothetical protein
MAPRKGTDEAKQVHRQGPAPEPQQTAPVQEPESRQFAVSLEAGHALRRRRRKKPWWRVAIVAIFVIALLGGGGFWVSNTAVPWFMTQLGNAKRDPTGTVFTFKGLNCRYSSPAREWKRDEAGKPLGVANLLTMQRINPHGWMALAAEDFKTRAPRDAEVVDDNMQRLANHFQHLETSFLADVDLAGQRAQHLAFQGRVNQVLMSGECVLLAHKGIVYFLAVWGPVDSARSPRDDLADVMKGFAFLKEREGWTEERPEEIQFDGHRVSYSLRGLKGLWEEWGQPEKVDAKADLVILAKERLEDYLVDKMAQVTVILLGPQKDLVDAVKAARAHVEAQHKFMYPATTMAVMRDVEGAQDRDMPVGNTPGHVVKLHVKNGQARERFLMLAVVQLPDQVIAIQCECDWKRRNSWEADFKQVLKTFTVKEK